MRELVLGIIASMFFAVTFILNRSMELSGGSWLWSSSLRFLFMVPFLFLIILARRNMKQVLIEIIKNPIPWIGWSFVGFVLFYAPITYAAAFGPGWLVAGTWQLTIVAGTLLGPLFVEKVQTSSGVIPVRHKIPLSSLIISLFILIGIVFIHIPNAQSLSMKTMIFSSLPVMIAAFAYPLGNRKMMEVCGGRMDTFQRVFGMTIVTIPFWLIIATAGYIHAGIPSADQVLQSFIVAISSGIIATVLFFLATDRVSHHQGKLASVEATQSTQVLFVMAGEIVLLSSPLPDGISLIGLGIIITGMFLHSFNKTKMKETRKQSAVPLTNKHLNP
jgi:hypothetical protein